MGSRKRRREGFEIFLEKEILTQERYDRLYSEQVIVRQGEESRQNEQEWESKMQKEQ